MNRPLAILAVLAAGCASNAWAEPLKPGEQESVGRAVVQPLRDLSLVRDQPDEVLKAARQSPYGEPSSRQCQDIATEIATLDDLLGPDIDSGVEQKSSMVGELAVGAVKGAVGLPFRGVVRKLTGAERRDRRIQQANAAGMARRSYLKGLRAGAGCLEPPEPPPLSLPPIAAAQ